ncbi:MAG TPA: bifunctional hydroxymethylpyrimidine kinase/phosphomethylpyrimidine kinase [Xanthomonadaceae bacterium]|nr:bifunctional hydroxymethylpyrimidine kinase/phosphomethylpyrimidine kinase [Xanthomonadaceae bacterium]
MTRPPPCVLTIAGSDSCGGAGIQADLKTFAAFGVHGLSAITALTAQNTRGVTAVHVPPVEFLRAQIDALFDDFPVAAVKLGMLADAAVIAEVAQALHRHRPAHVVLDPVMVATSGARLLAPEAVQALRDRLLPLASVLTPNIPEAELLLDIAIGDPAAMPAAAAGLRALGAGAVLLKGGHLPGPVVVDLLVTEAGEFRFEHPRLALEGHGTGCTLASAVAARLALGDTVPEACARAGQYVHAALAAGSPAGRARLTFLAHGAGAPRRR